MKIWKSGLTAAAMLVASAGLVQAQQVPGPHPSYLHALSDLRAARAYLAEGFQWEPVRQEDDHAIREIDAAIQLIKQAAIDDGKGLGDHPPIDGHLTPQNRFTKANELLYAAHQDLAKAEDVPQARALRDGALKHVDEAHNTVDHAVQTSHWQ